MTPDSESVLDMLDRLEREASAEPWEVQRYPNRTLVDATGRHITPSDKYFLALLRNHAAELLAVARAAETYIRADKEHQRRIDVVDIREALAPLTAPSEQKEET